MTFKLHIPGRLQSEAPPAANPANPLIGEPSTQDTTPARISGIAGLATPADREAIGEAQAERSAIISAEGVPYWEADALAGLQPWTAAEIDLFKWRTARSLWLAYPEAEGRGTCQ